MKLFAITALAASLAMPALAWDVEDLNRTVNSVNFIVDRGCSGTLISLEHRLILTNHHCITDGIVTRNKEIVGKDGVISKHRVEELRDLDVSQKSYVDFRLVGEATYKAEIVARWKESDLALLQIRADIPNAIAATVFPGDRVLRGEVIHTVGNPMGLDATVGRGVVSSVNRMFRVPWAEAEVPFIQIDSGIAGGNSGGSLFNDNGELIGVPAAGAPGTVIGLAIPFHHIQQFLTDNCYGEVWDVEAAPRAECMADQGAADNGDTATDG